MAGKLATARSALPFALTEAARWLGAVLRREPERRQAALAYARLHASAGDPASVLAALDEFARTKRFLMNVGDEKAPLLEEAVHKAGPAARVLELGTFVGYSAILFARHLGPEGRLVSIDVSATASRVASEMAELAGVGDRVEFRTGSSTDVIDELDEAFDVVLLDHWKGLYQRDMEKILERGLLRPGALVIADNLGPMFGDNPYLPWMQARGDFDSHYVESHLEYQTIEDGVLLSRWLG